MQALLPKAFQKLIITNVKQGESVAITCCGTIGLFIFQLIILVGASAVILIIINEMVPFKVNSIFNAGSVKHNDKYLLICRIEMYAWRKQQSITYYLYAGLDETN
jgi:hypothetical protein